ncbi:protein of unknown function DUF323 [Rhodomicrobium vannielii ATCC 17100]|uniref:TIR domain-containing protein n=1 Tax=Rhodomicrobium vannielii (strain ATCC 17100 / DSM 162 / LMG 4299 / NCIMB 10020 / ATH 3.1.1) TaxID=648757 RepID=E3I8Q1_RHOVT|nr:SUMF1/EgtB/PvdO family nonheme iron enzyme [Rhodomicrobium vannielii]ADP72030.1 protein of unknown function DUF323 [Rhodomicrobium vannielii ATCC 17100]
MAKIFLNYRRSDAEAWADRLYERLTAQFPRGDVFMDIDGNIPLGYQWAAWLDSQVAACDLMLVLIGRSWVTEFELRAASGQPDYVLTEIESALARKIPVAPVFLGDAPVPLASQLPASIRPLLALQATRLQRVSFEADAKALIDGVVRSIQLMRGHKFAGPDTSAPAPRDAEDGRIKVGALNVHGAPNGRFLPGAGRTEWFKDHPLAPEMVVVPAGQFVMGSPPDEVGRPDDGREGPQHSVAIKAPFAAGRFAVTLGEFTAFVEATGHAMPDEMFTFENEKWETRKGRNFRNPGFQQTARHPVVGVNWDDATAYCAWLSKTTGKPYRLLSEAEWEYVCRAGTATPFWWGADISTAQANYDGNYTYGSGKKGEYRKRTLPVESFEANPWGLYQVHGNVWEWCADNGHGNYRGAPEDGSIWPGGDASLRVLRGGSWIGIPQYLRAAYRNRITTDNRYNLNGFRLARTLTS